MPGRCSVLLFILFALCGLCATQPSASAQSSDPLFTASRQQLDVVKIVLAQQEAWNKGDLDGYLSHFKNSRDTQAVLSTLVRGMDNVRNAYRASFPNKDAMGSIEDTEVEVKPLGDTYAVATGRFHLTRSRKAGGNVDGTFIEVFEKNDAGWQIVYSAST